MNAPKLSGSAPGISSGLVRDPAGRRRPRRAGRDKTDVLAAAGRVIADRGADATRFADVSQASGVPVATLQYSFGSREDMIVAAFRYASATELEHLRTFVAAIEDPWQRLVSIVDAALGQLLEPWLQPAALWVESWRFAMRDAELRQDVIADYTGWRDLIAAAVSDGVSGGRFRESKDIAGTGIQIVALLDGIVIPLVLGDPTVSAGRARDLILDAVGALVGVQGNDR